MLQAKNIVQEIKNKSDPKRAEASKWFFKTGKGEYGEGDFFMGLAVPICRKLARQYSDLSLSEISKLLKNKIHEVRLIGLIILTEQFKKAGKSDQKKIVGFYLVHTKYINNWDLVDTSAHKILGAWLVDKKPERKVLQKLAKSKNLWEERIAIISTFAFLPKNDFALSLWLAEKFLTHEHDLIHKAVGWMLREVGKRDVKVLKEFLNKHKNQMPRTMLRYAIEKFPDKERKAYLKK